MISHYSPRDFTMRSLVLISAAFFLLLFPTKKAMGTPDQTAMDMFELLEHNLGSGTPLGEHYLNCLVKDETCPIPLDFVRTIEQQKESWWRWCHAFFSKVESRKV